MPRNKTVTQNVKQLGFIILAGLGSWFWQAAAHAQLHTQLQAQLIGNLTVQVEGLSSQEGSVCLKVFSGSRGFPNDNDTAVQRTCVAIAPPSADDPDAPFQHTFESLPLGTYAVAIYHDRNGDEQFNRGTFGAPIEGYGFSNDAPADTGPPRFGDAIFLVAGAETIIQIQMRYPN